MGLRSLAAQAERDYVDDLGFDAGDVAVLIGRPPVVFGREETAGLEEPEDDPPANGSIKDALDAPPLVELLVDVAGETLQVSVRALFPLDGDVLVQLVRYVPSETVEIGRGENAGSTFTYHNIVTEWETMATWNGRDAISVTHEVPGGDDAVVLVQQAGYGPILAAARAR